jgi:hypothetical protein
VRDERRLPPPAGRKFAEFVLEAGASALESEHYGQHAADDAKRRT